MVKGLLARSTK